MRLRWWILLALIAGLLLGTFIKDIPGFIVIAIGTTTIEVKLWIAVALFVLALVVSAFVIYLLRGLFGTTGRALRRVVGRDQKQGRRKTLDGMIALAEGHWKTCEDLMVSAAKSSDTQLINYLAAAQAAQEQGKEKRRDEYLRLAHRAQPDAQIAVGLTQAHLQLKQGQLEQALATLNHLKSVAPHHPHVLKLLQRLYQRLQDWDSVLQLLPRLRKYRVLNEAELLELETRATIGKLQQADLQGADRIREIYREAGKQPRQQAAVVREYAELLIRHGAWADAEAVLRESLNRQWHEELVLLYGKVRHEPQQQLETAERWLRHQANNAALLLTLGRLSLAAQLWGKAKSYLEKSLSLRPAPETYLELAAALEQLEQNQEALNVYKKGLTETQRQFLPRSAHPGLPSPD